MSTLKDDLDQYLLLQNDQKKKFNVKLPQLKSISLPLTGIFQQNATEPEANSWLKETQDTCCPQLVAIISTSIAFIYYIQSIFKSDFYFVFCSTLFFFCVLVTFAKDRGLCCLPWPRNSFHESFSLLRASAIATYQEICTTLYIG